MDRMARGRTLTSPVKERKPSRKYRWMRYSNAHAYEEEANRLGVSKVARSARGFMRAYETARTPEKMASTQVPQINRFQFWDQRRDDFIGRHLPQYRSKPSHRRRLALIMWAFEPGVPRATLTAATQAKLSGR